METTKKKLSLRSKKNTVPILVSNPTLVSNNPPVSPSSPTSSSSSSISSSPNSGNHVSLSNLNDNDKKSANISSNESFDLPMFQVRFSIFH